MPGNTPLTCLICGGISYGYHFGILACRACAAFFRRSVAEDKTYKCRNNFECAVNKDTGHRNMCRACRFKKCEQFGMEKNDVQMNRDPIGKKVEKASDASPSPATSSVITVIQNESNRQTLTTSNPPISIMPFTNLNHLTTLERLKQGYNIYRTSQKSLYMVLYPDDMFCEENYKLVSHKEFITMERGCISLLFSMLNDFYFPFNQIDKATKMALLQAYSVRFGLLSTVFCSYSKSPPLPEHVFQMHYGQYMDYTHLEAFFVDMVMRGEMISPSIYSSLRKTRKMFTTLKVDECEIAALAGIMLWNEVSLLLLDWEPAEQARQQIFQELHGYLLTKYGVGRTGVRIGSLLCSLHDLGRAAGDIMEHQTMEKIFNPEVHDIAWDELPR